jgi:hypothetical protein
MASLKRRWSRNPNSASALPSIGWKRWRWVAKSTEVIRSLTADDTLSLSALNQAQAVALAQSRMLALAGTLSAVWRSRRSGCIWAAPALPLPIRRLAAPSGGGPTGRSTDGCLSINPELAFIATPELADMAEFELLARERAKAGNTTLPGSVAAPCPASWKWSACLPPKPCTTNC